MVRIAFFHAAALFLASLSLFATQVLAQNSTAPACATECLTSAADVVNCNVTDTACQCASTTFAFTAGNCLGANCAPSDLNAARTFVLNQCDVGNSSSTSATSTSASSTSTSASSTTTSAPSTTATSPSTTTASSSSASPSPAAAEASQSGQPNGAMRISTSHGWVVGGGIVMALSFLGA